MRPFYRATAANARAPLRAQTAARASRWQSAASGPRPWSASGQQGCSALLAAPPTWAAVVRPCSCGGGSASAYPPSQTRRGAARSTRRSPTVRKAEREAAASQAPLPLKSSSHNTTAAPGRPGADILGDLSALAPVLDRAIEELGSDMTADACLDVVAAGLRVATSRTALTEAELEKEYNLTPYTLHSVAVLLLFGGNGAPNAAQCQAAAMPLLHLAATVGASADGTRPQRPGGYLPSTLTIVNMFGVDRARQSAGAGAKAHVDGGMRQSRVYQSAERQFTAYLAAATAPQASHKGQNAALPPPTRDDLALQADAFTLAGVVAESAGNAARALRWYKAARALFAQDDGAEDVQPREPKWHWERRCLEAIGRLQAAKAQEAAEAATGSDRSEARQALRTAALALGSGPAGLLLATQFARQAAGDGEPPHGRPGRPPQQQHEEDKEEQEAEMLLQRAAVGAVSGASEALAEREGHKAALADAANDKAELAFHRMMAEEWKRIAAASAAADMPPE